MYPSKFSIEKLYLAGRLQIPNFLCTFLDQSCLVDGVTIL